MRCKVEAFLLRTTTTVQHEDGVGVIKIVVSQFRLYVPHPMGKVNVSIKVQNWDDMAALAAGYTTNPPRVVETGALVDTGATRFYLQSGVIKALGLRPTGTMLSRTTNGNRTRKVYSPVLLEVQGRDGTFPVVEVDDAVPNLLGQIPLEYLDFVVDLKNRQLIPNPEHGGIQMAEEY